MPVPTQPNTPAERDRAQSRLRLLTRGAIVAATGATVAIGIVVAHDRPGASAAHAATTGSTSSSSATSDSGTTGSTGNTGNTGTSSSSTSSSTPTTSTASPTVTSGATS